MEVLMSRVDVEAVEVDQGSGIVRDQFEQEQTPASMAVTATLADVMDADPVPLDATVEPDALNSPVGVRHGTEGDIHATTTHEGHRITVSSHGVVENSQGHGPPAEQYGRDAGR